jgi:predicted metal-binding membrane protein
MGEMSMVWMRMPGQSWPGAAASFLGMWVAMMVTMMLPSLVPMLWRYRQAVERTGGASGARLGWLITLVGTGYFLVWAAVGVAVFPIGVALLGVVLREPALARSIPLVSAGVVLVAGFLQLTKWKARRIDYCSDAAGRRRALEADIGTAWRHGLRLGLQCVHSCASLMAISLAMGIMDLRVMALVAAAITAERVAPRGARVAHGIGVVVVAAGLFLVARAAA